jgi:hypothetical protein
MEFTKEGLIAAGYTDAQATAILAAHAKAIENSYVPIHRFNEVNTELKNTKTALTERDTQITQLKKFEGTAAELQTKVTQLETDNKGKDEQYKKEIAAERKRNAVKFSLLEDAEGKPHDVDMVMGLFNLEQITIEDATGKVSTGFKEQRDNLRKEKAFLFETKAGDGAGNNNQNNQNSGNQNQNTGWKPKGNPPASGSDNNAGTGAEAASYGKSLAAIKLGMMGKAPANNTGNGNAGNGAQQ